MLSSIINSSLFYCGNIAWAKGSKIEKRVALIVRTHIKKWDIKLMNLRGL